MNTAGRGSKREGDGSPKGFYQALGFRRNGQMEGDEVVLSLSL
jgi:hypothetical protein